MKRIWPYRHSVSMKAISLFIAMALSMYFLPLNAIGAVDVGDIPYGVEAGGGDYAPLEIDTFTVPAHLGEIKYTFKGKSKKFIVHLQDAHCNHFAQRKISDIIAYLNREYGIRMMNLEGGAGEYDLDVFTSITGEAIRKEVADYFVKKGEINGAELFAINNPDKVMLWGIEDRDLYLANLKVYRDSLGYKEEVDKYIGQLDYILNNLKRHIYTPELLKMDMVYGAYKAGNKTFREYLEFLMESAGKRGVDIERFENLYLLSEAMRQEETIDFKKANIERSVLVDELKNSLSKNDIKVLVAKTLDFKTKRLSRKAFYGYLLEKAKKLGFDLGRFPSLSSYIEYVSNYEAVNRSKVMDELDALEAAIKEKLYQNDVQRELNMLSRNLTLTRNIFDISLTKSDYKYYLENTSSFDTNNFRAFIEKQALRYKIKARADPAVTRLDDHREEISKFYEYSFKRDDVFIRNIRFSETGRGGLKTAVIMTGGFHTENLLDLFEKEGISYISILPKFTIEKNYENPYFDILAGQTTDVQRMLRSVIAQAAMLQVPSKLSQLGEDVWGKAGVDAFNAEVAIRTMAREGYRVTVTDAAGREQFTVGEGIEIRLDPWQVADIAHEVTIDRPIAEAIERGDFENLDDVAPGTRDRVVDFLRKKAVAARALGRADAAKILENIADSLSRVRIRLLKGVEGFEGHAGGMGIYINKSVVIDANGKINGDKLASILAHEAVGGYAHDHGVSRLVEEMLLGRGSTDNELAKRLTIAGAMRTAPVWEITSREERLEGGRDFAAVGSADWGSLTDAQRLDLLRKWQAEGKELTFEIDFGGTLDTISGRIMEGEGADMGIEDMPGVGLATKIIDSRLGIERPIIISDVRGVTVAGEEAAAPEEAAKEEPSLRTDEIELKWADNATFENFEISGLSREFEEDLPEVMKGIFEMSKSEIGEYFHMNKTVLVKNVRYIKSGAAKHVLRVEADVDGQRRVFGLRLMYASMDAPTKNQVDMLNREAQKEIERFNEFRILDGVAIFVKRSINLRTPEKMRFVEDGSRLDRFLDTKRIVAATLGEFAEGKDLFQIDNIEEMEEAYIEAIHTIMRGWLLTHYNSRGVSIGDLKGENFVKLDVAGMEEPVVYIDLGMPQEYTLNDLMIAMKEMLSGSRIYKMKEASEKGSGDLWIARTTVDQAIVGISNFFRRESPDKTVKMGKKVADLKTEINRDMPILQYMQEVLSKPDLSEEDVEITYYWAYGIVDVMKRAAAAGVAVAEGAPVEVRQKATVASFEGANRKSDTVRTVVGVPSEMNPADVQKVLREINRALAKGGYGEREDTHQVIVFMMDTADAAKTDENMKEAMEKAQKELSPGGRVILFAPQIEEGPELAQIAKDRYAEQENITVVPDAYSDSAPMMNEYPDLCVRAGLARHIAFYYNGNDKPAALAAINDLLRQVSANEGIEDIRQLLDVLRPLMVKAIDFEEVSEWMESQEAVAVSL
jgi:hypothetical protein